MKWLLVSYWFPPRNIIGALRVGKLAKYLRDRGYTVQVLAARAHESLTLPLEVPLSSVTYTEAAPAKGPLDPFVRLLRNSSPERFNATSGPAATPMNNQRRFISASVRETLSWHYYATFQIPDGHYGWIAGALRAGRNLLQQEPADLIYASAPPFSALVVASKLSQEYGIPWVAEFRDLWVENPYYEYPRWRRGIDRWLERRTLRSAAGLVTVTPIWADILRRSYAQPVSAILNGYSEEDLPTSVVRTPASDILTIVYTGNIYRGFRDPSPLFQAIAGLGPRREKVAVHFYGPSEADIDDLARKFGVRDRVFVRPRVSHSESLSLQKNADVLLLMQWNDKKDEGNIPAKLFEYLAVLRPILFLGYEAGTVAQMIRERNAGFVSNSPERIAEQLAKWIDRLPSGVPSLPESARHGLARGEQFHRLEEFIEREVLHPQRSGFPSGTTPPRASLCG